MYEQKTEEILLPIVEEYGFELVDVEYVNKGRCRAAGCQPGTSHR